ncbi:unnamed protein product [Mycena citricolor]|uniref:Uncharacterized protein n=1 Tax=Mycena citricolor TaxID=2018698 RepID=A0AAD2HSC0_9AGAR|nr:unnamed protein product [Mycena citricolor]
MLRGATSKPVVGILEASVAQSLLCGQRFGILSTGSGYRYDRYDEIRAFMGGSSEKFAGLVPSGLGVVELREGDRAKVEANMKQAARKLAGLGCDVIILGCAGMAGMEELVRSGVKEAELGNVKVVDGNKSGIEFVAALSKMAEMDVFAAMGIAGFGKAAPKKQLDPARFDANKRGAATKSVQPAVEPSHAGPSGSTSPDEPNGDREGSAPAEPEFDPDDDADLDAFPITHELILKDHSKVVSALSLDPSGARVLSGSHDYDCKLWDFGGMDHRCKPFKSWEPAGSYYVPINDLKYSNDGQKFLVITGTTQARLYNRDGEDEVAFIKGDPYIRDMKHTSGHVSELSGCMWHPKDPKVFITSSSDSTIRIWDVENKRKQKSVIVVKSKERGARTKVTTCAYSPDGNMIGGGCLDGALHLWQANSNFGGDDTVKLWDLRAFKKPLATKTNLPTLYPHANAVFSPDDKYVVTGAGLPAKGNKGELVFLSKNGLELVKSVEMDSTPVKVLWHSKINQIVTGLANGEISVLYSPFTSLNGAKLLANKGPPRKRTIEDLSDALAAPVIQIPGESTSFKEGDGLIRTNKRKRDNDRLDPRKARRPELPVSGPGRGGRVGASATQHVVQNLVRDTTRDEDPREALLKYAHTESNPQWTAEAAPQHASCTERGLVWVVVVNGDVADSILLILNGHHQEPELLKASSLFLIPLFLSPKLTDSNPSGPHSGHVPTTLFAAMDASVALSENVNGDHVMSNGVHDVSHVANGVYADTIADLKATVASESMIDIDEVKEESDALRELNGDTVAPPNGLNGTHVDVSMGDPDVESSQIASPAGLPPASSNGASTSHASPVDLDEDQPPPAKRARILSDADQASFTHSVTPPPLSAVSNGTTVPPLSARATLDLGQWRFCMSTIRSLKKQKDAPPFIHPVDHVMLQIPHYPSIVRNPMDLSTVERKLASSNPSKPDPNPENPRYVSADDFIADVRLVVKNCLLFNGADHPISQMAQRLEEVFDKQIKNLPSPSEPKPVIVKKVSTPPPVAAPVKKAQPPRRASTSMPVIRRSDAAEPVGRPKREIHPPAPKDLAYADVPKKRKTRRVKDDGTAEQLKFCANLLTMMHRKQYYEIASPFYEPVDHIKLDIPNYPKIIKKPMDLSTMRKKLDNDEYPNAQKFGEDFKLMIRNCFAFNPSGTVVNQAGIDLQRLFDEKWQNLPPLHEISEDDDEDDEDSEDEDVQRTSFLSKSLGSTDSISGIADMESQIQQIQGNIQALKGKPKDKKKKPQRLEKPVAASSSKGSTSKLAASKPVPPKKKGKKPVAENDALTFEQKKDLSEAIATLDGAKLEKVVKIIHEGVPEIKDSTEEIELEIDLLPTAVLTKLYNFVIRPLRAPATKRNRTGKGTGTGGLKRKSMDEDLASEKIKMLETRMALFEPGGGATPSGLHGSEHSSDSSDGSDSSGSDSE